MITIYWKNKKWYSLNAKTVVPTIRAGMNIVPDECDKGWEQEVRKAQLHTRSIPLNAGIVKVVK